MIAPRLLAARIGLRSVLAFGLVAALSATAFSADYSSSRRGNDAAVRRILDSWNDRYGDPIGGDTANPWSAGGRFPDSGSNRYDDRLLDFDRRYDDRLLDRRYDPRLDTIRYERPRYDDRLLDDRRYDDRLLDDRRYDDRRYETHRTDRPLLDRRYDDRLLDDGRYDDLRLDRRYLDDPRLDRRNRYDDPRLDRPYENGRFDPRPLPVDVNDYRYRGPVDPRAPGLTTQEPDRQQKLSARYGNPLVMRMVQGMSAQQGQAMYREALALIDNRHLQPSSYEARIRDAFANLAAGMENPAFLQASGASRNPQQAHAFRSALDQLFASRPVRNGNDAMLMLQQSMEVAGRHGVRPGAVALEFVYGATDSLDKYSSFIPDETASRPSAAILDDHVVGIGVEIKPHDQGALVQKVLAGGPAAQAGLQAGDVIATVNGVSLSGQTVDFAADKITGPAGSRLQLGVIRDGRPATLTLVRQQVAIVSVSDVRMIDTQNRVGYIKLDKFAKSSAEEMDRALWSLHQQGMQSLVLDLRGNPGGLLDVCVAIADKFLPAGEIVATRGRNQADNTAEHAKKDQTWKTPLVVLIDGDSASASEIFAAAIQDNRRGAIVGRHSYGKGTVQTHFPMQSAQGYLKLTTAQFYSPSGRAMSGSGVEPDVRVPAPSSSVAAGYRGSQDSDIAEALRIAGSPQLREMASATGGVRTGPIGR